MTSTASCVPVSRRPWIWPKRCSIRCSSILERYDLSAVGRVKMNMRLDLDAEDTVRTLRKEDIIACIKALSRCVMARAKSTTSTTSATAGFVPSAN